MIRTKSHSQQKGASLLIVLILLTVMLMGVSSLARMGATNTLIAGNLASKDAALNASEIGVSDAYSAIDTLVASGNPDVAATSWYFATYSPANDNASGIRSDVDWTNTALNKKTVGAYTVRYVVERLCTVAPVTDKNNQCMAKKAYNGNSGKSGTEDLESIPGVQYRVTVNVAGPKESSTTVQSWVVH